PEALWSLDVFQVDSAESGLKRFDDGDEGVRIFFVYFDVEYVNTRKSLEEYSLTFHYRLGCFGADISQSQYGRAIGDDRHEVSFSSVLVDVLRIRCDFLTRFSHARRIGQGKV